MTSVGPGSLRKMDLLTVAGMIGRREISPVEVVSEALFRAESDGPLFNCYITLMAEQAMAQARIAESEIRAGSYRGPLHGIPLSVKDIYWTKGVRTTAASRMLADFIPDEDATVVSRLQNAGAILIGKANTYPFACSPPTEAYGPSRNPWDVSRTTSGSSCGSAAAVAAGIDYGSFGSDTSGSLRGPCTFTGLVGLKPSYGLVSRHRMIPVSWTLDASGPMARSVGDVRALLKAVAGSDPNDSSTAYTPDLAGGLITTRNLSGIRIGLFTEMLESPTQPEVVAAIHHTSDLLRASGATVDSINIPGFFSDALPAVNTIVSVENRHSHSQWFPSRQDEYDPFLRNRLTEAEGVLALDYFAAMEVRKRLQLQVQSAMTNIDALLTPTAAFPATPLESVDPNIVDDERNAERKSMGNFNSPFNLSGQPALTLPVALSSNGLPIGAQLVGRHFEDLRILDIAECLERATGFDAHRGQMLEEIANPSRK